MELKLGEYQLIELRRMAAEAGTNVSGIIQGIVTMYLNNQVKQVKDRVDPRREQFIAAVLEAVGVYQGQGKAAAPAKVEAAKKSQKRIGRPPKLDLAQTQAVLELKRKGLGNTEISRIVGTDWWVVRDCVVRNA
jgi:hypothetical protein